MNKLLPAIILSAALALSGCQDSNQAAQGPPAVEVGVYTVKSEPVPLSTELPGRTTAYRVAEVRPQVNGIVLKRFFEEGAIVMEGELLYQIDPNVYQANYDKAVANMENLERVAKRQEALKDRRSISDQDYEDALYAWEQAKADAELARLNLTYCKVRAPLSGRIGRSTITEGALVTNGQAQAMAVINQVNPIFVDLTPAMTQLLKVEKTFRSGEAEPAFFQDADVRLTLEDGSVYPLAGKMKFLDNAVDQGTGTVTLRAEFPNPDGRLLPGMYVRARVQEGIVPDGKVIPQQALVRDIKGNPQVWVVGPDNVAEIRPVKADRTLGNTWLVTEGLQAGDRVVTEGLQRLAKGMSVSPREAGNVDIKLAYRK
ncbi:efflux RND transporter periplasmic adaptor subunit [Deltaproteobacteria bacterium OttesenSCG-928-M10]|nr:efflux RND transporter periplasmic adaptor subunit [Deltaproteobacteria bacterium OttesenSCG-928-M10]